MKGDSVVSVSIYYALDGRIGRLVAVKSRSGGGSIFRARRSSLG